MCKDCQCSNIKCNGALVANLDSFVRERKIDVSVFARIRNRSIIYCFGGVCAAASTILVVAIAKFGSYDKNRDTTQHA